MYVAYCDASALLVAVDVLLDDLDAVAVNVGRIPPSSRILNFDDADTTDNNSSHNLIETN